jgi:hypothetical protein
VVHGRFNPRKLGPIKTRPTVRVIKGVGRIALGPSSLAYISFLYIFPVCNKQPHLSIYSVYISARVYTLYTPILFCIVILGFGTISQVCSLCILWVGFIPVRPCLGCYRLLLFVPLIPLGTVFDDDTNLVPLLLLLLSCLP